MAPLRRPTTEAAALLLLAAAGCTLMLGGVSATIKVTTNTIEYHPDEGTDHTVRFEAERVAVDTDLAVEGSLEVSGNIASPTTANLQTEVDLLHDKIVALEKTVEHLTWQLGNVTSDVSDLSNLVTPPTCQAIKNDNPSAPSGGYTIDPDGSIGPIQPFAVYCEMDIDAGGWTVILTIDKNRPGYGSGAFQMPLHAAGYNEEYLLTSGQDTETDFGDTACLSSAVINAIGDHPTSRREYMVWVQAGLFKISLKNDGNPFDFFEGVWHSSYTNPFVTTIVHDPSTSLTTTTRSWAATDNTMNNDRDSGPGGCPGTISSSYCHYIPDDVNGGGRWAHRHNGAGGQGAGFSSSAHASKVWLR